MHLQAHGLQVHGLCRLAKFSPLCDNVGMSRRFVLLRHECPAEFAKSSHWDFMLEADGVLMTWELRRLPSSWLAALQQRAVSSPTTAPALQQRAVSSPTTAPAIRLADHRLAYLDYEGPLSGDRGSVRCVDRGTFLVVKECSERLVVELQGSILSGSVTLLQQGNSWEIG